MKIRAGAPVTYTVAGVTANFYNADFTFSDIPFFLIKIILSFTCDLQFIKYRMMYRTLDFACNYSKIQHAKLTHLHQGLLHIRHSQNRCQSENKF